MNDLRARPVRTLALALAFAALAAGAFEARSATHTWVGPAAGGWNAAANWTGGVPTTGEPGGTIVSFGAGTSSVMNIPGLVVDRIEFTGPGNSIVGATPLGLGNALTGPIFIRTLWSQTGTNTIACPLTLPAGGRSRVEVALGTLTLSGNIGGTGALQMEQPSDGTLVLSGTNTFSGELLIDDGTVALGSSTINGAYTGSTIRIGDGVGAVSSAILQELNADNIVDTATVIVHSDGLFDQNGNGETLGRLDRAGIGMSGKLNLPSNFLTIKSSTGDHFDGDITGAGGLALNFTLPTHRLELGGNSPAYTGVLSVTGPGTATVNGIMTGCQILIFGTSVLQGKGFLKDVTLQPGTRLDPGDPEGTNVGILTTTGGVLFQGNSMAVDLNGTVPGTLHDRLFLNGGSLSLGAGTASLVVRFGFTPAVGDIFDIIQAGGGATITGSFAGLPHGTTFVTGGRTLQITYTASFVRLTVTSLTPVELQEFDAE